MAAMVHHSLGHSHESQQVLEDLIARDAQASAYQIAQVYAWRGEKDKVFEWLQRAYNQRDGGLTAIRFDPLLNSVAADPRFAAVLRQLKMLP